MKPDIFFVRYINDGSYDNSTVANSFKKEEMAQESFQENEFVSPKEYFSNTQNGAFSLHCQKVIGNIYAAEYHIKKN